MTCQEVQDLVEALAAGDVAATPAIEAHVAGCRRCAAALEAARRIERALAGLPFPAAPTEFTRAVLARVRRERWRYEQHVDRAFNVTIVVGVLAIVAATLSLMNLTTVAGMLMTAFDTVTEVPRQPAPWSPAGSLQIVALAFAVFGTAVGAWWWADRRSGETAQ